jgi:hypothetical protein
MAKTERPLKANKTADFRFFFYQQSMASSANVRSYFNFPKTGHIFWSVYGIQSPRRKNFAVRKNYVLFAGITGNFPLQVT